MRVTSYNLKPIVKGSGPYHEMRWNVTFSAGCSWNPDQVPPLLRHLLALWHTLAENDRAMLVGYGEVLHRDDAEIRRSMIEQLRLLRRALRTGGHAI